MLKMLLAMSLVAGISYAQIQGEGAPIRRKTYTEIMPKDVLDLYAQNAKDLKTSGLEKKTLKVGKNAPKIALPIGGQKVPLNQIYEAGPLVLKFYRGGWCSTCLKELKDYEALSADFKKAGAQILAISPDSVAMAKKTADKNNFHFDVLSDEGHEIARAFGLVYKENPKILEHMKKSGINLSEYQSKNEGELVLPGTYVISPKGIIAFSFVDTDYHVRAEPKAILEVVQQIQKMSAAK